MKAFLGINFIMGINKLPSLEDCWSTDKCIKNEKIQNAMTRTRFQSILQNLHFSNNDNDDKTDKSYKICPVIEHLNKIFAINLLNSPFQDVHDKTDKSHKIRPVIENLNKVFAESLSNSPFKMLTSTYASLKVD